MKKQILSPSLPPKSALALAVAISMGAAPAAHAATFIVDTTDFNDSGTTGAATTTLSEAIAFAAGNAEADIIDLTTLSGTIDVGSGHGVQINNDELTINGPGADILALVSQAAVTEGRTSVFDVRNGGDVTINNVTIDNQRTSGTGPDAFLTIAEGNSALTLNNVDLKSTTDQGLVAVLAENSDITLHNSSITGMSNRGIGGNAKGTIGRGSAINFSTTQYSANTLNVNNTTISNNESQTDGGAIFVRVTAPGGGATMDTAVTINNSTLSGNVAGQTDGAQNSSGGTGGAVFISAASSTEFGGGMLNVNINNSTIINNVAQVSDMGASGQTGGVYVDNSTAPPEEITTNLNINNTIIANNTQAGTNGGMPFTSSGDLTTNSVVSLSGTNNLILDVGAAVAGGFGTNDRTALTGTLEQTDPMLTGTAPTDNGGPTLTFLPQAGSPVIGAGDDTAATAAGLTLDQRGNPRIVGSAVDIGAVELGDGDDVSSGNNTASSSNNSGNDDDDDEFLGSMGIFGLLCSALLLLVRRRKPSH